VLLADASVEEVWSRGELRLCRAGGRIVPTDVAFASEEELRNAIERILAPLGRRVDELSPIGRRPPRRRSRVNVVIRRWRSTPPLVSIRRFGAERPGWRRSSPWDADRGQREQLAAAVAARRSVLVSAAPAPARRRC